MTTANREYEALTTVEAVQKAFADGREVEYRTWSDRKWARAPSAIGVASDFIRGWEYRAPAASVGDAPSDAVAWQTRLTYPGGMVGGWDNAETEELADRRVTSIRELGDDRYSIEKRALYTAPPAAPVVSELPDAVEILAALSQKWGVSYRLSDHEMKARAFDTSMDLRLLRDAGLLSVPATDDKAPAVDAPKLPGLPEGFQILSSLQSGTETVYRADQMIAYANEAIAARLAAPTSPHDVDAVRVDEAMVERACAAMYPSWKNPNLRDGESRAWMRKVLTAALRKPGEDA